MGLETILSIAIPFAFKLIMLALGSGGTTELIKKGVKKGLNAVPPKLVPLVSVGVGTVAGAIAEAVAPGMGVGAGLGAVGGLSAVVGHQLMSQPMEDQPQN
jgi:hypothetical protein